MAQASTLSDAEMKKALRFCNTRTYVTRDKTILLLSLHTGLRAKEIAALRIKDIYSEEGAVRSHFILSAEQTKGARTRTVFVNKALKQQLMKDNHLMVELVVAEKLHKTINELREQATEEELWLWMAFFEIRQDEERKAMDKAKQKRR